MKFACPSCREKSIGMIQKGLAGKFWAIECKNCHAKLVREITGTWVVWMIGAHIVVPVLILLLLFFPPSWPLGLRIVLIIGTLYIFGMIDGMIGKLEVKE